ncbi:hypothetical protein CmeUKMEL1_05970 [Cryptosporidium meleagridis]|uniref:Uncharacterized protein n=1 Tax=Cryptosporidium meleagridis TaxID=93969 RepID=A0A2P4YZC8_9CRYT|nr:hypothetical protein CmeUKMEL1_05970 [Cryptosporidium meleagridis]
MKFIKCSKGQKRVLLMIILLLISYYIYIRGFTYSKNSRYVGRYIKAYSKCLNEYFRINWLEVPKLVSKLTNLLPFVRRGNIQKLFNWGNFNKFNNEDLLPTKQNRSCKYLIMLLNPWELPIDCVSEEFLGETFNVSSSKSSTFIMEHNLNDNPWRKELYRSISEITSNNNFFEDHITLAMLGVDLENKLSNLIIEKGFIKETGEDYLNRLLDMSLELEFINEECKRNVNIKRLWEFGRLYNELNKNSESSKAGESKYYKEFLAFVYYRCIYGAEGSNESKNLKKNTNAEHLFIMLGIKVKTDLNKDSFFDVVACYQLIPIIGIEDNELVSLGNLCTWEFEKKNFYSQNDIDQEKILLIRQHIVQIDEIYSKLDIIRLNNKYNHNLTKENEMDDFQTSYLNQLIFLLKKTTRQIMIQYTFISEEISNFINSSRKFDQNFEAKPPKSPSFYPVISTTGIKNNISNQLNKQISDSINWKQLISSIVDSAQNILVREHINTMLINFLFDAIINMLNPWISLFYQASFIINSYLSIISFLLVIVAILVCFNTIPCFRNEKDEKKSQNIWSKVLRIYKANVIVILLNAILILGGLIRYLYLPNEIELLNTNIAIIKAVNKVFNIVLCPCVVNIITSFSTVFSIFQWQLIWMSRKLSFSSLINL